MTAGEGFALRAARAEALAREAGAAVALLGFAGALLRAQERLAAAWERDASVLLGPYREFLSAMREAPAPEAAEEADARLAEGDAGALVRLEALFATRPSGRDDFLGRAVLRARLEGLRAAGAPLARVAPGGGCPACGGAPALGLLRPIPQSEGSARHALCAHCGNEWAVPRVRCAGCDEADPEKLPIFRSDRHAAVRVEACESCRRYLKTIDLSLDARPLPEVDELLSVSVDLWAGDGGWTRIEPGLAGV